MCEEQKFAMFDSIGIGIVLVDDNYTVKYINREIEVKANISREEAIGKNFMDFVMPEYRSETKDMIEKAKSDIERRIIVRVRVKDKGVWVHLSASKLGKYIAITIIDFDKIVFAKKELKEKNGELQVAYEFAKNMGVVTDLERVFEIAYDKISQVVNNVDAFLISTVDYEKNQVIAEFVIGENRRYPKTSAPLNDRDTLTGWVILHKKELYIRDFSNDPLPSNPKLLGTPMRSWVGIPLVYRDMVLGALSVQSKKVSAFSDRDIRVLRLISTYLSMIIHNAQLYKELIDKEEKYKSLVSSTLTGIISTNLENRITFVNKAMCDMLGYVEDEMVGRYLLDFVDEKSHNAVLDGIQRRKMGISDSYEAYLVKKDGSSIPVLIYASPLRDNEGNIIGTMATVLDISKRKELENKLIEAREFQRTLLHVVTHDLKTPLSVIQGYVDILREEFEPAYLDTIEDAVENALKLIQDVNTLSKLDMGKISEAKEKFSIHSILKVVADSARSRFRNAKIEVECRADIEYVGYAALLREAVFNLVINAFKHGASEVKIKAFENDKTINISVADNGPGVPDELKDKIFDSFVKYGKGGTGLGLSIVKRIVAMHKGRILVRDNKPKGSVFVIELPKN